MQSRALASVCAAISLVAAPVAVQAATTERSSAPVVGESEMEGNVLWILLAIAAIVATIVIIGGKDDPVSP